MICSSRVAYIVSDSLLRGQVGAVAERWFYLSDPAKTVFQQFIR